LAFQGTAGRKTKTICLNIRLHFWGEYEITKLYFNLNNIDSMSEENNKTTPTQPSKPAPIPRPPESISENRNDGV
jgi:hypothetical protein